jgi:dihydropteridine reductase
LVKNDDAKHNILLNIDASLEEQSKAALEGVSNALGSGKADAVLCVAGGWAGGNANSAGTREAILLCQFPITD